MNTTAYLSSRRYHTRKKLFIGQPTQLWCRKLGETKAKLLRFPSFWTGEFTKSWLKKASCFRLPKSKSKIWCFQKPFLLLQRFSSLQQLDFLKDLVQSLSDWWCRLPILLSLSKSQQFWAKNSHAATSPSFTGRFFCRSFANQPLPQVLWPQVSNAIPYEAPPPWKTCRAKQHIHSNLSWLVILVSVRPVQFEGVLMKAGTWQALLVYVYLVSDLESCKVVFPLMGGLYIGLLHFKNWRTLQMESPPTPLN